MKLQIDESYTWLREQRKPCQMFIHHAQRKKAALRWVAGFPIQPGHRARWIEREAAERRELTHSDRFIGVFDFTHGFALSLAEYEAECRAAFREFRQADKPPEPLLRRTGTAAGGQRLPVDLGSVCSLVKTDWRR